MGSTLREVERASYQSPAISFHLLSTQTRPSNGSAQPLTASGVTRSSVIDEQPPLDHVVDQARDVLFDGRITESSLKFLERVLIPLLRY